MTASDDKHLADTLPCLASTSKLERSYSTAGRTQSHADQHLKNTEPLRFAHTVSPIALWRSETRGHVMGGKKRNADAPGKATINGSLNSLLATVEAIFNLGMLGRNDTSAAPMS